MLHRNAASTPRARLRLARLIIDDLWPVAQAARRFKPSSVIRSRIPVSGCTPPFTERRPLVFNPVKAHRSSMESKSIR